MRCTIPFLAFLSTSYAAQLFLDEPDTGLEDYIGPQTLEGASGNLIPIDDIITIPDFEQAARAYMSLGNYSYYRTGAAGEYSKYQINP